MTIILGFDPGSRKAGFGLIELCGKKIQYLDSGTCFFDANKDFLERLPKIDDFCSEILSKYHPDEVAMESLIYVKSPTSLIKLAQARGAMLSVILKKYQNHFFEYAPNLIKSTVGRYGHADKASLQRSLYMILGKGFKAKFDSDDESDALAVAICHAFHRGVHDRISFRQSTL